MRLRFWLHVNASDLSFLGAENFAHRNIIPTFWRTSVHSVISCSTGWLRAKERLLHADSIKERPGAGGVRVGVGARAGLANDVAL